jgi:predicted lipoprotein with Yx(FWY)xxD motif
MSQIFKTILIGSGGLLLATSLAAAAGPITAKNGMTLYVFDKDKGTESACYDKCAVNWPPYLGEADAKLGEDWTLAPRKDGALQWAYDGHLTYFFKDDAAKGDAKGDGLNGVWHVLKE